MTRKCSTPGCELPDDVRDFIRHVTTELQVHRNRTEEQKDRLFQMAYRLYAKYEVEGKDVVY